MTCSASGRFGGTKKTWGYGEEDRRVGCYLDLTSLAFSKSYHQDAPPIRIRDFLEEKHHYQALAVAPLSTWLWARALWVQKACQHFPSDSEEPPTTRETLYRVGCGPKLL